MSGELIYEYTIQSTGATSYGVPALDALLSGYVAEHPSDSDLVRWDYNVRDDRPRPLKSAAAGRG